MSDYDSAAYVSAGSANTPLDVSSSLHVPSDTEIQPDFSDNSAPVGQNAIGSQQAVNQVQLSEQSQMSEGNGSSLRSRQSSQLSGSSNARPPSANSDGAQIAAMARERHQERVRQAREQR